MNGFYVYVLRCSDATLYTGWTGDIQRRLRQHNAGCGSKYTRVRQPVALIYWEECSDKSAALKREAAIKRMSRRQKLALCVGEAERKGDG